MAITKYQLLFDTIMKNVITDYENLDQPPANVTKGSIPFIIASMIASQSWGLRKYQDFIAHQTVPGPEMDTEFLNKWAGFLGIVRTSTDTDATLLDKILNRMQFPPAGGNKNDYKNWALDQSRSFFIDNVAVPAITYFNAFATVVDIFLGPGTVGVFTIPNDETIIIDPAFSSSGTNTSFASLKLNDTGAFFDTLPNKVENGYKVINTTNNVFAFVTNVDSDTVLSLDVDIFLAFPETYAILSLEEQLRQATFNYIETQRTLGLPTPTTVVSAKPSVLNIIIDINPGSTYDDATTKTLIGEYRDGLAPGESFFSSQAICIALANGALSANVTTPAVEETTISNSNFHRGGSVITNLI